MKSCLAILLLFTVSAFADTVRRQLTAEEIGQQCETGDLAKFECNNCRCSKGNWACTRMACPPVQNDEPERIILTDETVSQPCEKGQLGKHDCNNCMCGNGQWACTLIACNARLHQRDTSRRQLTAQEVAGPCTDGDLAKSDCNSCHCTNQKWACTRIGCPQVQSDEPVRPVRITLTEESIQQPCENKQLGKLDCNNCFCGNGRWGCTLMACPKNVEKRDTSRKDLTAEEFAEPCTDGDLGRRDCNNCYCTNQKWACTKKGCPQIQNIDPVRITLTEESSQEPCENKQLGELDCNSCFCANGRWVCTLMACLKKRDDEGILQAEVGKPCSPEGIMGKDDCNSCRCAGGSWACTRMGCDQSFKIELPEVRTKREDIVAKYACKEGDVMKQDCNDCVCGKGGWACTYKYCPKPGDMHIATYPLN